MVRVQPVDPAEMPDEYPALETIPAEIKEEMGFGVQWINENRVLRTMGNNTEMLEAHVNAFLLMWGCAGLSLGETELALIAMARERDDRIEWQSHVPRALAAGYSEQAVVGLSRGDPSEFTEREKALIGYVQSIVREDVTDQDHETVASFYDDSTIVGIAFMTTYYIGWTTCMKALGYTVEELDWGEFIGWELEHYDETHPKYIPEVDS